MWQTQQLSAKPKCIVRKIYTIFFEEKLRNMRRHLKTPTLTNRAFSGGVLEMIYALLVKLFRTSFFKFINFFSF
jgi:hypothetical protein